MVESSKVCCDAHALVGVARQIYSCRIRRPAEDALEARCLAGILGATTARLSALQQDEPPLTLTIVPLNRDKHSDTAATEGRAGGIAWEGAKL